MCKNCLYIQTRCYVHWTKVDSVTESHMYGGIFTKIVKFIELIYIWDTPVTSMSFKTTIVLRFLFYFQRSITNFNRSGTNKNFSIFDYMSRNFITLEAQNVVLKQRIVDVLVTVTMSGTVPRLRTQISHITIFRTHKKYKLKSFAINCFQETVRMFSQYGDKPNRSYTFFARCWQSYCFEQMDMFQKCRTEWFCEDLLDCPRISHHYCQRTQPAKKKLRLQVYRNTIRKCLLTYYWGNGNTQQQQRQ